MQHTTAARPYAQAIYELAREEDALARWSDVLASLLPIVADSTMQRIIRHPRVDKTLVAEVIHELCGDALDEQARNLVSLLAERERLGLMPEIARLFEQHRAAAEGSVDVEVVSAYELDPSQQSTISEAIKGRVGKDVHLDSRVDRDLIGGAVIRMGDSVIDLSLRGRLNELRNRLNS